jgi:hypothetical protein
VHRLSILPSSLPQLASSDQVTLRHPEITIYRCFLPDLTGFIALRRARPSPQRRFTRAVLKDKNLEPEFNPAIADLGYRAPLVPRLARPNQILLWRTELFKTIARQTSDFGRNQEYLPAHAQSHNKRRRQSLLCHPFLCR